MNDVLNEQAAAPLEREVARLRAALENWLRVVEEDDVPGYLGDESGWECTLCAPEDGSGRMPTTAEVKHEPDCFQGAIEIARAALLPEVAR